jgi:hypothetical protein
VDPSFKSGTSSYNPDLDDANGAIVGQYYNCSEVGLSACGPPITSLAPAAPAAALLRWPHGMISADVAAPRTSTPTHPGQIAEPLFNLSDPASGTTTNQPPQCAQLYNPRGLPWAFHHFPMDGRTPGFPVWFDINLDADDAQAW